MTGTIICGKVFSGLKRSEVVFVSSDDATILIYLNSRGDMKNAVLKLLITIYTTYLESGRFEGDLLQFFDADLKHISWRSWLQVKNRTRTMEENSVFPEEKPDPTNCAGDSPNPEMGVLRYSNRPIDGLQLSSKAFLRIDLLIPTAFSAIPLLWE